MTYERKQPFLFPVDTSTEGGKNQSALQHSRDERERILDLFGGSLPLSVIAADKGRPKEEDTCGFGSYDASSRGEGAFAVSGRGAANGALSIFPQNILRTCLLLYSQFGDTVLDPFAGHNSRMEGCVKLDRGYVGFDVSKRFMEFNRSRLAELKQLYPSSEVELHLCDSRKMNAILDYQAKDFLADFTITSPPYYDIEDYGDEPEQLRFCETYLDFMVAMSKIMQNVFRYLKPGAFCCWFINDFRRNRRFHAYHADSLMALQSAGFEPWDIMIVNLGWTMRAAFATQVLSQRILPKIHEYGLIMRKPL